jgi:hypothetical protein
MTVSRGILLTMTNVSDKSCRENQNTFYVQWPFSKNRSVYEIMSKNMEEPKRTQTIWRLRVAYWITKQSKHTPVLVHPHPLPTRARAHTHTETRTHTLSVAHTQKYVILIASYDNNGFVIAPQCYKYIACLVRCMCVSWRSCKRVLALTPPRSTSSGQWPTPTISVFGFVEPVIMTLSFTYGCIFWILWQILM